ncbi:MAG TPA: S8 family serine peptidase, partial [Pyrinomonadaceae bacterium]
MKKVKGCRHAKLLGHIVLLVSLCVGGSLATQSRAQGLQLPEEKVSKDLLDVARSAHAGDRVKVIIQTNKIPLGVLDALLSFHGGQLRASFTNFNARVVELPARAVAALAARFDIDFISLDRESLPVGHVSATSGADAVRVSNGTTTSGLDGTGIGIAVIDSGIDTTHKAFLDKSNNLRVVFSKDFTGEGRTDDPYGHGTHVASIVAGNGRISNAEYIGIAPNANIINLRVLGATGAGNVSWVLSALDWVMTNRALYNIRVVNMSLGAPAIDSYKKDPVCLAVRKLVDAGIVV